MPSRDAIVSIVADYRMCRGHAGDGQKKPANAGPAAKKKATTVAASGVNATTERQRETMAAARVMVMVMVTVTAPDVHPTPVTLNAHLYPLEALPVPQGANPNQNSTLR
jgi:hypothetical protein